MSKIRVHNLMVSLDGFAAGAQQSLDAPMGLDGHKLSGWVWETEFGRAMIGQTGGATGIDNQWLERGVDNIGATVMGRNMFGPIRDEWPDDSWTGWWGDEPPFHHPVFVLTHYPRTDLTMSGGTTFHFVTDGIDSALEQAVAASHGQDVRVGGGVATVREGLKRGLIDYLHIAMVPVLLGSGERLWDDLGAWPEGYTCTQMQAGEGATHVVFERV